MIIGLVDDIHLFLGVMDVSHQLLQTNFRIDDGREVLFDFTANGAICGLYLEGLCVWHTCEPRKMATTPVVCTHCNTEIDSSQTHSSSITQQFNHTLTLLMIVQECWMSKIRV